IILQGNTNPYEVRINTLVDGVVADRVNFSLGPKQTETSCLRVEIYGKPCDNSTGPTQPPKIEEVIQHKTYQYVAMITWQPLKSYFVAGELKGYKVIFFIPDGKGRYMWWKVPPDWTYFYGPYAFQKNTTYCATVLAFNEYGEGPAEKCTNITIRDGACPVSWKRHGDSCYLVIRKPANWTQAKLECLSRNSQLVTITNNEENKFVADLADDVSWIGAQWNELMENYSWVDGSEIGFTEKWINKKMDSSLCVGICENVSIAQSIDQSCGSVGEWQQGQCVHLKPFVCEREDEYLEVTFKSLHSICALATQGLHEIGAYTKTYRLQLSIDGLKWEWYTHVSGEIIQGNNNSYDAVKQEFTPYTPTALHVRIWPVSFCVHPCLRIELYGEPSKTQEGPPTAPPSNLTLKMASMHLVIVTWNICLPGWTSHGGHCYRAFKPTKSWADADAHCLNLNSDLMSIHSEDENQLGKSLFTMDADYIWIGLRVLEKDVQMDKNQWSGRLFCKLY
ncbi:hypothetical protein OS493_021882, partial [Desmophyllum pertusum]